jgi:hypothetical protein
VVTVVEFEEGTKRFLARLRLWSGTQWPHDALKRTALLEPHCKTAQEKVFFIWSLGRKSRLSMSNKLLTYKVILEPIWIYGIQLWGSASTSNIEILERFQSKALCMIADAPWYVPNVILRQDLQIPSIKEEIQHFSIHYSSRLHTYPNSLAVHLTEPFEHRRLKRHVPTDLITRFQE